MDSNTNDATFSFSWKNFKSSFHRSSKKIRKNSQNIDENDFNNLTNKNDINVNAETPKKIFERNFNHPNIEKILIQEKRKPRDLAKTISAPTNSLSNFNKNNSNFLLDLDQSHTKSEIRLGNKIKPNDLKASCSLIYSSNEKLDENSGIPQISKIIRVNQPKLTAQHRFHLNGSGDLGKILNQKQIEDRQPKQVLSKITQQQQHNKITAQNNNNNNNKHSNTKTKNPNPAAIIDSLKFDTNRTNYQKNNSNNKQAVTANNNKGLQNLQSSKSKNNGLKNRKRASIFQNIISSGSHNNNNITNNVVRDTDQLLHNHGKVGANEQSNGTIRYHNSVLKLDSIFENTKSKNILKLTEAVSLRGQK